VHPHRIWGVFNMSLFDEQFFTTQERRMHYGYDQVY
jgi:hypothetical protein